MPRMDLLSEHARELARMGPEWDAYRWNCVAEEVGENTTQVTGAVAPLFTDGPKAGEHNWRKRDKRTERIIYIRHDEQDEWERLWRDRTGKCLECAGNGKVFHRWSQVGGTEYRPCKKCEATGLYRRPAGQESKGEG